MIKVATSLLPSVSLLVVSAIVPSASLAQSRQLPADLRKELCELNMTDFPTMSYGECSSMLSTQSIQNRGSWTLVCKFFEEDDPELFYQFWDSFKDCNEDSKGFPNPGR